METHRISESGPDRELLGSLRALTGLDTPATIERFETEYPNATFWATFGQSEASGLAMLSPYRDRPKSAGRPLFWRSIAVVDGDDRANPAGEIIDFVNGQIARYKRPKHVVLVDKLPRTAGATSIGLLLNQRTADVAVKVTRHDGLPHPTAAERRRIPSRQSRCSRAQSSATGMMSLTPPTPCPAVQISFHSFGLISRATLKLLWSFGLSYGRFSVWARKLAPATRTGTDGNDPVGVGVERLLGMLHRGRVVEHQPAIGMYGVGQFSRNSEGRDDDGNFMTDGRGEVCRVPRIGGVNDELRTKGRAMLPGEPAAYVGQPRFETVRRALVEHRKGADHASLTGLNDQIRSRETSALPSPEF